MSGSSQTGSSHVNSAEYDKNRVINDAGLAALEKQLVSYLGNQLGENGQGNALANASSDTLANALTGNYSVTSANPYIKQLVDNIYATTESDFKKNYSKAYSDVQGLGEGTKQYALGDVYSNYLLDRNNQVYNALSNQYNTDVDRSLNAAQAGVGEDPLSKFGTLALGLISNRTDEYGHTPVVTESNSRYAGGIKN